MILLAMIQNGWLTLFMGFIALFVAALVMKSENNRRTMHLIKTYTDQGKTIPPQLLELLKH